jgi:hypothetical protein
VRTCVPPDADPYLFWFPRYFDGLTSSFSACSTRASVQNAIGSIATFPACALITSFGPWPGGEIPRKTSLRIPDCTTRRP